MVHKSPAPNLKEQVFTIGEISVHDGGIGVHDGEIAQAPDSADTPKVFTMRRNQCSRSSGISVHDPPELVFTMARNSQMERFRVKGGTPQFYARRFDLIGQWEGTSVRRKQECPARFAPCGATYVFDSKKESWEKFRRRTSLETMM